NHGIGTTNTSSWDDMVFLASDPDGKTIIANLGTFRHTGVLARDGSYDRTVNVTLPNGLTGTFYAVVTTGGPLEVIYTDKNRGTSGAFDVTLTPPPDLTVTDIAAPTTALAGSRIDLSWTVRNEGPGDASGQWVDRIVLRQVDNPLNTILLGSFTFN